MKTKFYILSIFLFFLIPSITFPQNWNGVCVGINDYPGSGNDLSWCVSDANVMRQYLITYKQWSNNKISLLTNSNASEEDIENAIQNMPTSSGNIKLLHYAGHGGLTGIRRFRWLNSSKFLGC